MNGDTQVASLATLAPQAHPLDYHNWVQDARAKGRTAEDAASLVGWSRATLYRHQQALAARENITT